MSLIAVCNRTPDKARGNATAISVMGHTVQPGCWISDVQEHDLHCTSESQPTSAFVGIVFSFQVLLKVLLGFCEYICTQFVYKALVLISQNIIVGLDSFSLLCSSNVRLCTHVCNRLTVRIGLIHGATLQINRLYSFLTSQQTIFI